MRNIGRGSTPSRFCPGSGPAPHHLHRRWTDPPPSLHSTPQQPPRSSSTSPGLVPTRPPPAAEAGRSSGRRETHLWLGSAVEDDAMEGTPQSNKTPTPASPPPPRRRRTPYIHRRSADPGIPHPPAAGAAGGGGGIPRIRRRPPGEPEIASRSPLSYCRERVGSRNIEWV